MGRESCVVCGHLLSNHRSDGYQTPTDAFVRRCSSCVEDGGLCEGGWSGVSELRNLHGKPTADSTAFWDRQRRLSCGRGIE